MKSIYFLVLFAVATFACPSGEGYTSSKFKICISCAPGYVSPNNETTCTKCEPNTVSNFERSHCIEATPQNLQDLFTQANTAVSSTNPIPETVLSHAYAAIFELSKFSNGNSTFSLRELRSNYDRANNYSTDEESSGIASDDSIDFDGKEKERKDPGVMMAIILMASLALVLCLLLLLLRKPKQNVHRIIFIHPFWYELLAIMKYSHVKRFIGGGGEKVLYDAVNAVTTNGKHKYEIVIISAKLSSNKPPDFCIIGKKVFGTELATNSHIKIIQVKTAKLTQAHLYPILTMLFQALGMFMFSIELSMHILMLRFSSLSITIIDTTGFPFALPLLSCFCDKLICYSHYPLLIKGKNDGKTNYKTLYHGFMLKAYQILIGKLLVESGKLKVFANSTWTRQHLIEVFELSNKKYFPVLLYPSVVAATATTNVSQFKKDPYLMVCIGQFRQEKNQIRILHALKLWVDYFGNDKKTIFPHLVFVGGVRDGCDDMNRVLQMKEFVEKNNLSKMVEFRVNESFEGKVDLLRRSSIGLHSMVDEHFGISIVEYMEHGCIPIVHNSGGPKADIIPADVAEKDCCGYLAIDPQDYCDLIEKLLYHTPSDKLQQLRQNTINRANRLFSQSAFTEKFLRDASL